MHATHMRRQILPGCLYHGESCELFPVDERKSFSQISTESTSIEGEASLLLFPCTRQRAVGMIKKPRRSCVL